MGRLISYVVILAATVTLQQALAAVQTFTMYERPFLLGKSVTLTEKYPDTSLLNFDFGLNSSDFSSYCFVGAWRFYDLPNFHLSRRPVFEISSEEKCQYFNPGLFKSVRSLRYIGPADYLQPALAFYETMSLEGEEHLVTDLAAKKNFEFVLGALYLFGNSSWTLYSGSDFDGESFCFAPKFKELPFTNLRNFDFSFVPKSVVRGCEPSEVSNNIKDFKGISP